ncbi:hypothetical protein [uncultured Shewanella sp.]|uniref:hypothetical protein n=1 Tax=uncultured Shewanella sp. TaxID=173975 RepID=UPI002618BE11|nr:hypothetical protein [uncultured Shewanella sp.]
MKIENTKHGSGKHAYTSISWDSADKKVEIEFPVLARCCYSKKMNKIFASLYQERQIYLYDLDGGLYTKLLIPIKDGYQYMGLNANEKSTTGIALLYAPSESQYGNEWGDYEQYELLQSKAALGKFIDIYR